MTVSVPQNWRCFVLDDTEDRLVWFRRNLPNVRTAKTSQEAIEILASEPFDCVFLDHDLHWMDAGFPHRQFGNGKEVARFLAIRKFAGKVVIHSRSEQAATMAKILPQADVARYGEFDITVAPPAQTISAQSLQAAAR